MRPERVRSDAAQSRLLRLAAPFVIVGAACVIAGGLVSAAIAPSPTEHGAWAVAYLVLVAGVAQIALGIGQSALTPTNPSTRLVAAQCVGWNAGNAAVIVGTLVGVTAVVDVGGALLVIALGLLVYAVRGRRPVAGTGRQAWARQAWARQAWVLQTFRVLVVVLLVSIPVGLVLTHLRH